MRMRVRARVVCVGRLWVGVGVLRYITRAKDLDPTLWKSSVEMNLECTVFSGGSDPDDVHQGLVQVRPGRMINRWLAMEMNQRNDVPTTGGGARMFF